MGKQAKKKEKSEAQLKGQKKHNRNTKGINTKKQGSLWAIRHFKDDDGKLQTYEVRVPHDTKWDPWDKSRYSPRAPEPFDSFQLDWREELTHYANEHEAKIGSVELPDGYYAHRVYFGESAENPEVVLVEVQSSKKLLIEKRGPRRRSRRKKA